jgi:type II secretory pathway pseudopilin PulG
LIGILLPALGGARNQARKASTQALMSHLQANIDTYFTRFNAYPGPFDASLTAAKSAKISGTQNLLLGLSYTVGGKSSSWTIPGTSAYVTSTGSPDLIPRPMPQALGPVDYASIKPDGSPEQLSLYFEPTPSQLAYIDSDKINTFKFPTLVDTFQDGLPILYYRRTVGSGNPVTEATYSAGAPTPPSYYYQENAEYTNPSSKFLKASSGVSLPQSKANFQAQDASHKTANLDDLVRNNGAAVRGGYVLMSAGIDRVYGTRGTATSDDVVIVGGD